MEAGEENKENTCDISDILETFKKYQIIQYLLIFLPEVVISMISINYVFVAGDVNYRCRIDECEDANSTALYPTWWPDTSIGRCFMPVHRSVEEVCTNNSFTSELVKCDHWIYESNNTVVAEFNLACQPWKSNVIGTVHCLGMLFSMLLFGWVSDKFGRKPALIFCIVAGSVGIIKTVAPSYHMYLIIEFLEAMFTGGFYTAAMVMLMEIASKPYRLLSGITCAYAIYLGELVLACIAWFVPYWKTLVYITYGPCIFFIFFIFFINESPRWQIVNGRTEDAKKTMKRVAEVNKIRINNEELANIDEATLKEKFDIKNIEVKESLIYAFKSKEIMKRLFVAGICRFTTSFVYNGMMINSVWLPGDKYMNFLLTSVMSFPGELISLYLMNKIGRKLPLMVGLVTSGIMCIISAFIPIKYSWVQLSIFLISKVLISACFTGAISYTMELFPTSVRASLLGLTSFCSRLGGMLSPLTPILSTVLEGLPFLIFGGASIISGSLLCLTPETKDLPLYDTITQIRSQTTDRTQQQQE